MLAARRRQKSYDTVERKCEKNTFEESDVPGVGTSHFCYACEDSVPYLFNFDVDTLAPSRNRESHRHRKPITRTRAVRSQQNDNSSGSGFTDDVHDVPCSRPRRDKRQIDKYSLRSSEFLTRAEQRRAPPEAHAPEGDAGKERPIPVAVGDAERFGFTQARRREGELAR